MPDDQALDRIAGLEAELEQARSQQPTSPPVQNLPDLEALEAEALVSLKLGKQSPGYKAALKAITKFRNLLESS